MSDFILVIALAVCYASGYLVGRFHSGLGTAVFLLTLPRCQEEEAQIEAALDGLKNRGVITADQAEEAKARIAKKGGEA